jgi:hypothetical protein
LTRNAPAQILDKAWRDCHRPSKEDTMFDAQTIQVQGNGSEATTSYFGPWFSRGGDYGIFTAEVAKFSEESSDLTFEVSLYHKDASAPGDGDAVTGGAIVLDGSDLAAALRAAKDYTAGFRQLVRYKFTLKRASASTTGRTYWATFRMLSPTWYDKV